MNKDLKFTYLLLIVLILIFSLNPFMKKTASKNLNSNEYLIINHILLTIVVILYAFYLFYHNKCDRNFYKKMSRKEIIWAILAAVTSIIGALAFITLIQKEEISFILPNIHPIVLILAVIVGYFIFNETMNSGKLLGIIFIVVGAVLINYNKVRTTGKHMVNNIK